ncbi:MAG: metallophosphoesterase [Planctomycetota bacterium]|nr:metallophosphoesterase [Planctomycetota bacterium]
MRILVSSDLHYNIPRSRASAEDLAARACRTGGDALVLVGDTAGADMGPFREALRLFEGFGGLKALVPGNHCLWAYGGGDSLHRYRVELPALAAQEGFVLLDHQPQTLGGVGLAGSIGWYDYSFADESLGIPLAFYRAKLSPGAANYLGRRELVAAHAADLNDRHMSMGVRWMDGQYVKLGMSDEEFTALLAETLRGQLETLSASCERIVAFLHHLPFAGLVPRGRPDRFKFAAAFLGAGRLGEVLMQFPKVTNVFCGHSHWRSRVQIDQMDVLAMGSTYIEKHLDVLEL